MELDTLEGIAVGNLNVDILAFGFETLRGDSGIGFGTHIRIAAGGKGRNMAEMMARLLGENRVAMLGATSRDPIFGRLVFDSLTSCGVNVDFVSGGDSAEDSRYPGLALIPVDRGGNNHIYAVPGTNEDFSTADVDKAKPLFEAVARNHGVLLLTLEPSFPVVCHLIATASQLGLRIVLDPGGMRPELSYSELLQTELYLIKPNRAEARRLTGIEIVDLESAFAAADKLKLSGVPNVLVTLGADGAVLVTGEVREHIPVPSIKADLVQDETGCGDQVAAAICARLLVGDNLPRAARCAIAAGTLQFTKPGVEPIREEELAPLIASQFGAS